jgi:hypothetical protein
MRTACWAATQWCGDHLPAGRGYVVACGRPSFAVVWHSRSGTRLGLVQRLLAETVAGCLEWTFSGCFSQRVWQHSGCPVRQCPRSSCHTSPAVSRRAGCTLCRFTVRLLHSLRPSASGARSQCSSRCCAESRHAAVTLLPGSWALNQTEGQRSAACCPGHCCLAVAYEVGAWAELDHFINQLALAEA